MRLRCVVLLLIVLLSCTTAAFARDWFVSPTGNDGNDGSIGAPLQHLDNALGRVSAGDVIQMRAGTYSDGVYRLHVAGTPAAHITLRSYDGDYAANQDASIYMGAWSYVDIEGINFSIADGHCINCCGEETSYNQYNKSHHVTFKRCKFHERDTDGVANNDELIKCAQSEYLTFEDCEVYVDNGTYTSTSFALDFVWVSYSTLRRMYLHDHNGTAVYTKGGSQYNVLEQSVLAGDRPTSYGAGIQTGDGTGLEYANPNCEWETENYIVRNNVIRWGTRAAFFVSCVRGLYAYNNLLIDCGDSNQTPYPGLRAYVALWADESPAGHMNGRAELVRFYNNIFYDTGGNMGPAFGYNVGTATDWARGNNNYYNNGNAIPTSTLTVDGVLLDPSTEPGATIGNPNLNNPTGTATTWQGWVNLFRPTTSSTALTDRGNSNAGDYPRPYVVNDIEGNPRPRGAGWDIGPFERDTGAAKAYAEFAADQTALYGLPATVNFSDQSAGVPTSWSWTFGDGYTSTLQNPSHTYTTNGLYTVSLTASNGQGQTTKTKTNYLDIRPLLAAFTSNVTWGDVPLAVQFTDQSYPSATAWSWTFGDGGTSTAQNPSHTYTTMGNRTVTLVATNAQGSDTCTKASYIGACTGVMIHPDQYAIESSMGSYVSGSLTDLQTDNAAYMVFACPTSGGFLPYFRADTGYLPSQVRAIDYQVQLHSSVTDVISVHLSSEHINLVNWHWDMANGALLTNVDQWLYRTETNAVSYMTPTGTVGVGLCGCPQTGNRNFNVLADVVTFLLHVTSTSGPQPPVANFTGNPTSGGAPLAVAFTDTSTNTPTSWSWTFGDTNTSTAQNPSHTYSGSGSYTVALTAANAQGNNTCTKNNYIIVSSPSEAVIYPDAYTYPIAGAEPTLLSGGLSNLQLDDASYMVQRCNTGAQKYAVSYTASSGYLPSQVSQITLEYQAKCDRSDTPSGMPMNVRRADGGGDWIPDMHPGLTDTDYSWVTTNVSTYLSSTGVLGLMTCGCPNGTNNYTISSDRLRWRLQLVGGQPAPVADFSGTPTSGTAPLGVTFTDSSTNTPTSWSWSFGDSATSTAQNPTHSYAVGTYTVSLTATNAGGQDTCTMDNYITSTPPPPVANFSATPTTGTAPLAVAFTDTSTNTPTSWSWTFGDSNTSTAQNPSHTYAAGTFTVTLTATNAGGSDGETKTNYITVTTAAPTFVAAGTVASGTGTIAPALPTGRATNDILLLFVETANQASAITNQNGGTWTQVTNSPQSTGSGTTATRLTVFWSRNNGTQGAPTVSDSGDHQLGRIIAIRGATTSGDPCDITAGSIEATADTSGSIAGATTTVANTLVVAAIATSLPDANGTANFSAWTNANLTSLTERTDNTANAGNGGGLGIATGVKATAGAYTTTAPRGPRRRSIVT